MEIAIVRIRFSPTMFAIQNEKQFFFNDLILNAKVAEGGTWMSRC